MGVWAVEISEFFQRAVNNEFFQRPEKNARKLAYQKLFYLILMQRCSCVPDGRSLPPARAEAGIRTDRPGLFSQHERTVFFSCGSLLATAVARNLPKNTPPEIIFFVQKNRSVSKKFFVFRISAGAGRVLSPKRARSARMRLPAFRRPARPARAGAKRPRALARFSQTRATRDPAPRK